MDRALNFTQCDETICPKCGGPAVVADIGMYDHSGKPGVCYLVDIPQEFREQFAENGSLPKKYVVALVSIVSHFFPNIYFLTVEQATLLDHNVVVCEDCAMKLLAGEKVLAYDISDSAKKLPFPKRLESLEISK